MKDEVQAAQDDNMPPLDTETVEEKAEVVTDDTATSETAKEESQETEITPEQKALNKLAFEKREEKRQRIAAQEELDKLKAQIPAQTEVKNEPRLEDYDYDDAAFQAALIDYKVGLKVSEGLKTVEQRQIEKKALESQQVTQQSFNAKVAELTKTVPNYAENVGNLPDFPSETLNTIMQMDNGPEVANYLGLHANIADEIAGISPIQAAVKLGQISTQLSTLKPEVKTSAAPEPIEPVSASGSLNKSYDDMSMEEIYNL